MMGQADSVREAVAVLEEARRSRQRARLPAAAWPGLTIDRAYAIQRAWVAARMAQGRRRIGYKVAFTTPGSQRAQGIDRPGYGILLDDMRFADGSTVPSDGFLAPRVEVELAFSMGKALGAGCDARQALDAVEWFAPAIEIVDSRVHFQDAETGLSRSAVDIIADGGATAGLVLSDRRFDPAKHDPRAVTAVFSHNGDIEDSGVFALILGAPERALVALADALADAGETLMPGDLVLCGSVIKAYPTAPGDRFDVDYGPLGQLSVRFG